MSRMYEYSNFWEADHDAEVASIEFPCPFTIYVNIESRKFCLASGDKEMDGYIKIATYGCYDEDEGIEHTDKPVPSPFEVMRKHRYR